MEIEIKFEDALSELEDTVRLLESGTLSLDDAISSYEKAVRLVRICNAKITDAEQKVMLLTEDGDGVVSDRPFIQDET